MELRSGGTLDVLRLVVGGRSQELDMSNHATRKSVGILVQRGLVERPVIATEVGVQALADWDAEEPSRSKRRAARDQRFANCELAAAAVIKPPRQMQCDEYPLAETDEQISKLKELAEADRSLGFESINQRKTMKS